MCAGGCTRVIALILLIVASLALAIHFIAPYQTRVILLGSYGYLGRCPYPVTDDLGDTIESCIWFTDNDFKFVKNLPDWWYACIGLSSFGIIFLLVALPAGMGSLCCCKSDRLAWFTGSITSFACLLMAISIGVWGWGANDRWSVVPFKEKLVGEAEWAWYLGLGGIVLGWISSGLFFCSRTREY